MSTLGRAPVEVGAGYVDIVPQLNVQAVEKMREQLATTVGKSGEKAAGSFKRSMSEGLSAVGQEAGKAAKSAATAVESEAKKSADRVHQIQRTITEDVGREAGLRLKAVQDNVAKQMKSESELGEAVKQRTKADLRAEEELGQQLHQLREKAVQQVRDNATEQKRVQSEIADAVRKRTGEVSAAEDILSRKIHDLYAQNLRDHLEAEKSKTDASKNAAQDQAKAVQWAVDTEGSAVRLGAEEQTQAVLQGIETQKAAIQSQVGTVRQALEDQTKAARQESARTTEAIRQAVGKQTDTVLSGLAKRSRAADQTAWDESDAAERSAASQISAAKRISDRRIELSDHMTDILIENVWAESEEVSAALAEEAEAQDLVTDSAQLKIISFGTAHSEMMDEIINELHSMDELRNKFASMIDANTRKLNSFQASNYRATQAMRAEWRSLAAAIVSTGEKMETFGSRMKGMFSFLAVGGAVGGIAKGGMEAADSLRQVITSMTSAGFDPRISGPHLDSLKKMGLGTPYGPNMLWEQYSQIARSLKSEGLPPEQAAEQAELMVRSLGDFMAVFGKTDKANFQKSVHAIIELFDRGTLEMQHLNQLTQDANITEAQLAKMMGFKDVLEMRKAASNKKTGGIKSDELREGMIKSWMASPDVQGASEKQATQTMKGHWDMLKGVLKFQMGALFGYKGADEKYHDTDLGVQSHRIMDKIMKLVMNPDFVSIVSQLLKDVANGLELVVDWATKFVDFLKRNEWLKELIFKVVRLIAVLGPLATIVGITTKVFGKLADSKLVKGVSRTVGQVAGGLWDKARGKGTFREGYRKRRDKYHGGWKSRRQRMKDRLTGPKGGVGGHGKLICECRCSGGKAGGKEGRKTRSKAGSKTRHTRPGVGRGTRAKTGRGPSVRGKASMDTSGFKRALASMGTMLKGFKTKLTGLNKFSLSGLGNKFAALKGPMSKAAGFVRGVGSKVLGLNKSKLSGLGGAFTGLKNPTSKAGGYVKDVSGKVSGLNKSKLGGLGQAFLAMKNPLSKAGGYVKGMGSNVSGLNRLKLGPLGQTFMAMKNPVSKAGGYVKDVSGKVSGLNRMKLGGLGQTFMNVKGPTAKAGGYVKGVGGKVSGLDRMKLSTLGRTFTGMSGPTSKASKSVSGVGTAVGKVDRLRLSGIVGAFGGLIKKVGDAITQTGLLELAMAAISFLTGGRFGKSRKTKKSSGGVLPGYAPGVDSVPALLSPGEAILRPEVARFLGAPVIDHWNAMAARGQIRRYAKGTSGIGKGGKGGIIEWINKLIDDIKEILTVSPGIAAFTGGIGVAEAGRGIGGPLGEDISGWGVRMGGGGAGSLLLDKFDKLKAWVFNTIPDFLKRAPKPDPISWLISQALSVIAPHAGQHFWDDVWKGHGNIAQRAVDFGKDMIKDIPDMLWDLVKELGRVVEFAKQAVQMLLHPIDTYNKFVKMADKAGDSFDKIANQVQQVVDFFTKVINHPSEFAKETAEYVVEQVKELMPNTEGLFDFSKGVHFATGGVVPGYAPGRDSVPALLSPGEGVLTARAVLGLGRAALLGLNMGAKPDFDPSSKAGAGSVFDNMPVPNSQAYQRATQAIRKALDDLERAHAESVHRIEGLMSGLMSSSRSLALSLVRSDESAVRGIRELSTGLSQVSQDMSGKLVQSHEKASQSVRGMVDDLAKAHRGLSVDVRSMSDSVRASMSGLEGSYQQAVGKARADMLGLVKTHEQSASQIDGELGKVVVSHNQSAAKINQALGVIDKGLAGTVENNRTSWTKIGSDVSGTVDTVVKPAEQRWMTNLQGPLTRGLDLFKASNRTVWTAVGTDVATQVDRVVKPAQARWSDNLSGPVTRTLNLFQGNNRSVWAQVSGTVSDSVDRQIRPAQQRWESHLDGPSKQALMRFRETNRTVWESISGAVASAAQRIGSQCDSMDRRITRLRDTFRDRANEINQAWYNSMRYLDNTTRTFIEGPYNKGVVPMMAAMAHLAGTPAPLAAIHNYARGGVVPGYRPGVDMVPAMLSPGEGILRPEVVRYLGEDTIRLWNEQARRTGTLFARGGVVPDAFYYPGFESGGEWVDQHKDDPFEGYMAAFREAWDKLIRQMLAELSDRFRWGVDAHYQSVGLGPNDSKMFEKSKPWLEAWVKWLDDNSTPSSNSVVKVALEEYAKEAPMYGGAKYNLGNGEQWCSDFISWVVDHAHANAAYGNSPTNTPYNRWPAVISWVNAMPNHVPTLMSQPGDLMIYGPITPWGAQHINLKTGADESVGGNEHNTIQKARGYWRRAQMALRPTGGNQSTGQAFNPWPGSIPAISMNLGGGGDAALAKAIVAAMRLAGVSGDKWFRGISTIIQRESSGDPRAINLWDTNWTKYHDPSCGLMQIQVSNFKLYHVDGTSWDIFDPVANIAAAIRYILATYKAGIDGVQQADPTKPRHGYWRGVRSASPGIALVGEKGPELVGFSGGERVLNNKETQDVLGKRYEVNIFEAKSETTTQAVIRGLKAVELMYGKF